MDILKAIKTQKLEPIKEVEEKHLELESPMKKPKR